MRGLAGKAAVVTGGGRGMGAACARRLSEEGCSVVVVDIDLDVAKEVAASLPVPAFSADVATEAGVAAYHRAATDAFGRLDLYHLKAGIGGNWVDWLTSHDLAVVVHVI